MKADVSKISDNGVSVTEDLGDTVTMSPGKNPYPYCVEQF